MAITRYGSSNLLNHFQQRLDDLGHAAPESKSSNVATSAWMPLFDIKEEPERFIIKADLPGVNPDQIELTLANGALTIRAERSSGKDETEGEFHCLERPRGVFYRCFTLPDTADAEQIKTSNKDGVLEMEIPKGVAIGDRKIEEKS